MLPYFGITAVISLSKLIEQFKMKDNWLLVTSASSYIIYLFHTTFEGLAKAIVFRMPYLKDVNDDRMFLIGAIFVVACGVIIPIVLNERVFKKYSITRVLLGLK